MDISSQVPNPASSALVGGAEASLGAAAESQEKWNKEVYEKACKGNGKGVSDALAKGGKPNGFKSGGLGMYPLHEASVEGHLSTVIVLLQAGATVDAVENGKRTALHCAAIYGKIQVVEELLNAGADKALKDNSGKTALDYAQTKGHPAIVKLLRDWPH